MHSGVQQSIILQSLNLYAPEGGPKGLPACFPYTVFPATVLWERVAAGLGLRQRWWGGGRTLWWAGLAWAVPCSLPVKVFRADPGVIEFGLSCGSFLAPVRRTGLAFEEKGR